MRKKIKLLIYNLGCLYHQIVIYYFEIKKIIKKRGLWKNIKIDKKNKKEIKRKFNTNDYWHRYYQYFTGKFDINYFPEMIFSTKLENILNPKKAAEVLSDKSLLNTLYGDVNNVYIPKTIVQNCYGRFFDSNGLPISYEQVEDILNKYLSKHNKAIIKPTLNSCSGKNVNILTSINGWNNHYKENYIIQELVSNQEDIAKLNPNSFNTMRVITYICDNKYCYAPIVLKMGGGTSHLDNGRAGGIFVGVKSSGELCQEAYSEYGKKYSEHPYSKIKFCGYKIRNLDKVIDTVIDCHKKTPQFGMISWDVSLNKAEEPVIIEANLWGQSIWLSQISHGKGIFGDNTNSMLKLLNKKEETV